MQKKINDVKYQFILHIQRNFFVDVNYPDCFGRTSRALSGMVTVNTSIYNLHKA